MYQKLVTAPLTALLIVSLLTPSLALAGPGAGDGSGGDPGVESASSLGSAGAYGIGKGSMSGYSGAGFGGGYSEGHGPGNESGQGNGGAKSTTATAQPKAVPKAVPVKTVVNRKVTMPVTTKPTTKKEDVVALPTVMTTVPMSRPKTDEDVTEAVALNNPLSMTTKAQIDQAFAAAFADDAKTNTLSMNATTYSGPKGVATGPNAQGLNSAAKSAAEASQNSSKYGIDSPAAGNAPSSQTSGRESQSNDNGGRAPSASPSSNAPDSSRFGNDTTSVATDFADVLGVAAPASYFGIADDATAKAELSKNTVGPVSVEAVTKAEPVSFAFADPEDQVTMSFWGLDPETNQEVEFSIGPVDPMTGLSTVSAVDYNAKAEVTMDARNSIMSRYSAVPTAPKSTVAQVVDDVISYFTAPMKAKKSFNLSVLGVVDPTEENTITVDVVSVPEDTKTVEKTDTNEESTETNISEPDENGVSTVTDENGKVLGTVDSVGNVFSSNGKYAGNVYSSEAENNDSKSEDTEQGKATEQSAQNNDESKSEDTEQGKATEQSAQNNDESAAQNNEKSTEEAAQGRTTERSTQNESRETKSVQAPAGPAQTFTPTDLGKYQSLETVTNTPAVDYATGKKSTGQATANVAQAAQRAGFNTNDPNTVAAIGFAHEISGPARSNITEAYARDGNFGAVADEDIKEAAAVLNTLANEATANGRTVAQQIGRSGYLSSVTRGSQPAFGTMSNARTREALTELAKQLTNGQMANERGLDVAAPARTANHFDSEDSIGNTNWGTSLVDVVRVGNNTQTVTGLIDKEANPQRDGNESAAARSSVGTSRSVISIDVNGRMSGGTNGSSLAEADPGSSAPGSASSNNEVGLPSTAPTPTPNPGNSGAGTNESGAGGSASTQGALGTPSDNADAAAGGTGEGGGEGEGEAESGTPAGANNAPKGRVNPVNGGMTYGNSPEVGPRQRCCKKGKTYNGYHEGTDIYGKSLKDDRDVVAVEKGTVSRIRTDSHGYGKYAEITYENGVVGRYAHIEPRAGLEVGDSIATGESIGKISGAGTDFGKKATEYEDQGMSKDAAFNAAVDHFEEVGWGNTTRPHLHYEERSAQGLIDSTKTLGYSGRQTYTKGAPAGLTVAMPAQGPIPASRPDPNAPDSPETSEPTDVAGENEGTSPTDTATEAGTGRSEADSEGEANGNAADASGGAANNDANASDGDGGNAGQPGSEAGTGDGGTAANAPTSPTDELGLMSRVREVLRSMARRALAVINIVPINPPVYTPPPSAPADDAAEERSASAETADQTNASEQESRAQTDPTDTTPATSENTNAPTADETRGPAGDPQGMVSEPEPMENEPEPEPAEVEPEPMEDDEEVVAPPTVVTRVLTYIQNVLQSIFGDPNAVPDDVYADLLDSGNASTTPYKTVNVLIDEDTGTMEFSEGYVPDAQYIEGFEEDADPRDGATVSIPDPERDSSLIMDAEGTIIYSDGRFAPPYEDGVALESEFEYVYLIERTRGGQIITAEVNSEDIPGNVLSRTVKQVFSDNSSYTLADVASVTYTYVDPDTTESFNEYYDYTITLNDDSTRQVQIPVTTSVTFYGQQLARTGYEGDGIALTNRGVEIGRIQETPQPGFLEGFLSALSEVASRVTSFFTRDSTGEQYAEFGALGTPGTPMPRSIISTTVYLDVPLSCPDIEGFREGYVYETVVTLESGNRNGVIYGTLCGTGNANVYANEIAKNLVAEGYFTNVSGADVFPSLRFTFYSSASTFIDNVNQLLRAANITVTDDTAVPNTTNQIMLEAKVTSSSGTVQDWVARDITLRSDQQLHLRWDASMYARCLPFIADNGSYSLQRLGTSLSMTSGNTEQEGYDLLERTGPYRIECDGQKNGESGIDMRTINVNVQ